MKAVILAAGMGTRLGSLVPKPLTALVNEKTILDFQIERLSKLVGADNIILVIGYKPHVLMEKFPDMLFVYNARFAQTNTAKSLLCATKKVDDDMLWLNGDVFFEEGVLELLTQCKTSSCLVDNKKCAEEEVKYTLNKQGFIHELSKQVQKPLGEALGINLIRKADIQNFVKALDSVADKDYFEKALEILTVAGKLDLKPINVGDCYCREIDFPEDLVEVQKFLTKG